MDRPAAPEPPPAGTPAPAPRAPEAAGARRRALAALAIAGSAALAYSNTFDVPFHFDDHRNIVQNAGLRDLGSLWPPAGRRWLGFLTFALNLRLGGLDVRGFHAVNLAVHVAAALLVARLAATTLRTPALRGADAPPLLRRHLPLAAGLLFALHPIATQAVTYVVQRFTSLAALLFLASIVLYAEARLALEGGRPSRRRAAILAGLSVLAAAGAMKTKEIAVTLPFVAAGYDLLLFRGGRGRLLLLPLAATLPIVPLDFASGGRLRALSDLDRLTSDAPLLPVSAYLLTQARVVATYLRLLVLPVGQSLDHDFPPSFALSDPRVLASLAVLAAVAAGATVALVRARRAGSALGVLVFLGTAWFFVTLAVESSIVPLADVIAEHRVYLPGAGAALALAALLLAAAARVRPGAPDALRAGAAIALVAVPLGAATWARNLVWRDSLSLWRDVAEKAPGKARARSNLGVAWAERGRLDDAIREFRAAARLEPWSAQSRVGLGAAYATQGRLAEAIPELEAALAIDPGLALARSNLGAAYHGLGRLDEAIREYRRAVALDPGLALAHANLGVALLDRGEVEEAVRVLERAVWLVPDLSKAHRALARAYRLQGRSEDAARALRRAEETRPPPGALPTAR